MWLVKDSALAISNANATIAHEALKSGANGFWGYSRIFIQTCTDGSRMRARAIRNWQTNALFFWVWPPWISDLG